MIIGVRGFDAAEFSPVTRITDEFLEKGICSIGVQVII